MSQTQLKSNFPKIRSVEEVPLWPVDSDMPQIEPEATWEPYLELMMSWEHADVACTKALERANANRQAGENRVRSTFETDKNKLDSAHEEQMQSVEAEKKAALEEVDARLKHVTRIEIGVRRALGSLGLETLMDDIQVPIITERGDSQSTKQSLQDSVARSAALDEVLQDDLFAIRAARQRQSAQMWAVGIGLWLVAAMAFAPYAPISALLVGIGVFTIATPRKIHSSDELRPSFAEHIWHCLALLVGKQQVMQYPFSLVEKGREVSSTAFVGAFAAALISWVIFKMGAPLDGYEPMVLARHLGLMGIICGFAGVMTFAMANQDLTLTELAEGNSNKILR